MSCPGCQQPMTWIDKVRPFCRTGCDRLDGHDGRDAGVCTRDGEVLEPGPPRDDRSAPGLPYKFFGMTPCFVSPDGEHWYQEDRSQVSGSTSVTK